MEVISTHIIKPSSPTPHHLKWLKLSLFDQTITNVYVPLIFFYQANESEGLTTAQISQQMKQSLSNTLTLFYPLAGRVVANSLAVDCNDAGVEFIEAQVKARLMDVIEYPDVEDLKKYAPIDPVGPGGEMPLLQVQITLFGCGGIALGVNFSHLVTDFHSVVTILNVWASLCRGESEIPRPANFDLPNYYPAREDLHIPSGNSGKKMEKYCLKRFVFNQEIVENLKQIVVSSSGSGVKDPTRVELISGFIWKVFLEAACKRNPKSAKMYAVRHAVNLRGRNNRSHSLDNAFGNYVTTTPAYADATGTQVEEFSELVSKMRSSIKRIDDDYITGLQLTDNNSYLNDLFEIFSLHKGEELEWLIFSSWCRFPVYEMDYGFGAPLWYCPATVPQSGTNILLTSNRSGDILEAWINAEQENLQLLEAEIKLISDAASQSPQSP